jgi:alpha-beta hydrolase superfamily lysophospholipase
MNKRKQLFRRIIWTLLLGFIFINVVAFFHAYKFTHFVSADITKTKSPEKLSSVDKIKTLLLGVNNPRPTNKEKPSAYTEVELQSNKKIHCWYLKNTDTAKGTVILFHGYSGEKSSMLDKAEVFEKLNYHVLLVDFMGSGGSEGNQTTLGFKEAEQVKTAFDYVTEQGEKNIYLFGTSMGSVAIMKALADDLLKPKGIIIECPFGSMYETTCARFKIMNAPTFPMAGMLVFWGGVQNNFWALGHNPTEYAKEINSPALLLYGEQDRNVSRQEIDEIFKNLKGEKTLRTYERAGHDNYCLEYKAEWIKDITGFLQGE